MMSVRDEAGPTGDGGRALRMVLARLADRDSRVRAAAADEAGDYFRGRYVDQATAEAAVAKLVAVAVVDGQDSVQEAALHACGEAVGYYDLPLALFEPLVPLMSVLSVELIGYVLGILGLGAGDWAGEAVEVLADPEQ